MVGALVAGLTVTSVALAADYPITAQQRGTAQKVAQNGVPISDLVANAPDSYTVKTHDTLWDISKMYLKSPWRWPELWGMNMAEIRNPHLIYPGQVLYLEKTGDRARLRLGQGLPDGTTKLSPRVRSTNLDLGSLASVPFGLIEPFLNEAIIFQGKELDAAPRIVATQEGRVNLAQGDTAYVRGDLSNGTDYRIFRQPKPLLDPTTKELLGYEAVYVGAAEYVRQGETHVDASGKSEIVPATFMITQIRQEAGVGDRLAVAPAPEYTNYAPHAPQGAIDGQIVSLYGDALSAGQNQIVALNRGAVDGLERGNILALVHTGEHVVDTTDSSKTVMKLPDERQGLLFVFRVFDRMSYALILSVRDPVSAGDRFTQP
jgi:LysM domain